MVTSCPVCGHDLVLDPNRNLLRCSNEVTPHGHFPWTCGVSGCGKPLVVVREKQYGAVAMIAPYLEYLRCTDGHGLYRWYENLCILWERYEADHYYYFYVQDGGGDRLMPFSQGISLSGPDGIRCYIRGDRVSGSVAAANSMFREMSTIGPVPRTSGNGAAINYIVQEMAAQGFEDVWHAKNDPWYMYYFYSEYPRHPRPSDWHQRMEQVR